MTIGLALPAGTFKIQLPRRRVTVGHSCDLNIWQTWNAPGNDGIPRNPSIPFFLAAPTSGPKEFFR